VRKPLFGPLPSVGSPVRSELKPFEIQDRLNTRLIGKTLVWNYEVDSTNDVALGLASTGAPDGTVVLSESQRRGRGRMGRSWYSPPGEGIYLSVLLKPPLSPLKAYQIPMMATVATVETLNDLFNLEVKIKWPNDLMLRNRKLGGILTELKAERDRIQYVVVGIGINANMTQFSEELKPFVTSLALELGRSVERVALVRALLRSLEKWYFLMLEENSPGGSPGPKTPSLFETWRSLSCTVGNRVEVKTGEGIIQGLATRIAPDGSLYVREESGKERHIVTGDVALVVCR